jgi:hypothetical protein
VPETISIRLNNGQRRVLEVEEPVYPDRSCGQFERGWRCYSKSREYFVSETGDVWRQPGNIIVGVAPEIKAQFEEFERMMERCFDEEAQP